MSTFGERIRTLRGNMSQQNFADKLSITRQYVALLESDRREASPLLIDALCRKFHIRREWLETGNEPMTDPDASFTPEALVPDLVAVLSEYPAVLDMFQRVVGHMTPADWQRLNSLLDEVLETKKEPPQP